MDLTELRYSFMKIILTNTFSLRKEYVTFTVKRDYFPITILSFFLSHKSNRNVTFFVLVYVFLLLDNLETFISFKIQIILIILIFFRFIWSCRWNFNFFIYFFLSFFSGGSYFTLFRRFYYITDDC